MSTAIRTAIERMTRICATIRSASKSGAKVTKQSLAIENEVSARTIQRDIEFLRDRIGMPFHFDYNSKSWRSDPSVRLPWWVKES